MAKRVANIGTYDRNQFFKLPNLSLLTQFARTREGNADIVCTPWIKAKTNRGKEKEMQRILNEWLPHLDKLESTWPGLLKFEKDLGAKVGPLSVMKPLSERIEDVEAYYTGITLPAQPIANEAIEAAVSKFKAAGGLRVRSQTRTVDLMKKSTSSGSPFYRKRKTVVDETIPCYLSGGQQILDGRAWESCAVLGWRGQEGGPTSNDVKQRVIWMFPFAVNIEELRLYQPLIEGVQKNNLVPAWVSMESVDQAITKLFDTKGKHDLIVCTDFTKFDQHFNPAMQECAKRILTELMYKDEDSRYWLNEVFPIKYNIPMALSENTMSRGMHGMGSGSGGTNADETLAHTALQFEAALKEHQALNPNSMCLGDDGILTFPGITAESVTDTYTAHGLEMNLTKQEESENECTYLRRWHSSDYRINGVCAGVYATTRALGRLCMQERYYDPDEWGPKMVALRELSIIENVKYHPLKEEFVEFCMKRDKYRLGLDIPGFLDNIVEEAKKAIANMPDFLGYTRSLQDPTASGIGEWWIVKHLKSMR